MKNVDLRNETSTFGNALCVSGLVTVLKTPITERYCKVGDTATLDLNNKQIRCSGAWFKFDERWVVQPYKS